MDEKLNSLLSNPQLMQQVMSLAQSLGQASGQKEAPSQPPPMDPKLLGQLSNLAGQSRMTSEEEALLKALAPYLCSGRLNKLEKAMRSAKIAKFASGFLNSGGLQLLTGR